MLLSDVDFSFCFVAEFSKLMTGAFKSFAKQVSELHGDDYIDLIVHMRIKVAYCCWVFSVVANDHCHSGSLA